MTEYWVSQKKHWCEYCHVWLQDTAVARATHERGQKHLLNVEKKLRTMRKTADSEKRDAAAAAASIKSIEAKAEAQFKKDMAAMQAAVAGGTAAPLPPPSTPPPAFGTWVPQEDSGYYYNAQLRWYFDPKTKWYYGGEPAEWTQSPNIPEAARYENTHQQPAADAKKAAQVAAAAGGVVTTATVKRVVKAAAHPMADLGGHSVLQVGAIGASKGLVSEATAVGQKRKGESASSASKKPLSKEEAEFIAKREAARARVQNRTATQFGAL